MFETYVTKKDITDIKNFLESGVLVNEMNKIGLSFGAMALVLNSITSECDRVLDEMNKEKD